jgi:hypothetical protein
MKLEDIEAAIKKAEELAATLRRVKKYMKFISADFLPHDPTEALYILKERLYKRLNECTDDGEKEFLREILDVAEKS